MCLQIFVVTLRIARLVDQDVLFWLSFIPVLAIILSVLCYVCITAHRDRVSVFRETLPLRRGFRNHVNERLMEQIILHTLRDRLELIMLANRERMRMMGVPGPNLPRPNTARLDARIRLTDLLAELGVLEDPGQIQRGMNEQELNNLPVEKYLIPLKGLEEPEVCSICIEEFQQEQDLRRLPCSHRFHQKCVDEWLKISTSCPNCKAELREGNQNPIHIEEL